MSNERSDNQSQQEYADTFTGLSKPPRNDGHGGFQSGTMSGGAQDATLVSERGQNVPAVVEDDQFIGRTIGDHYQILSRLGSGGMSVVYKARHTLLHRNMAVKFLLPQSELDSKTLSRFQQEAKAAFVLNHLNIARVNELGIDNGEIPYIVMDFVEGPTVGEVIESGGPMQVNRVLNIMSQACAGLEHAHSKDIIHRDIKPGNLILTTEGNQGEILKIVDFGIAKILHEAEGTQHLTQTGEVFGSPLYMSPEQAMGRPLDHRCDVYALGCVMYETLAGQPPFRGLNILDTLTKHINDDPPPLTNAPAALRLIVKKAMEKNPADRYQTMAEFRKDLEAVVQGNESKLTSTIKLLIKPKVRRWVVPVAVVGAGLAGLAVWGCIETAPSPRFDHRVATSWTWTPEPAAMIAAEPSAATAAAADANAAGERSFGDVKNSDIKDRLHLAVHISDADKLYEKESPSSDDLSNALKDYSWASENWASCNAANNDSPGTRWDQGLCESRLADCYMLTGKPEQALPHYKAAHEIWVKLGEAAAPNAAMSGLDIAYLETKLKTAMSDAPSNTWDALKKNFDGNKYLGIVRQDWSNVQWNLGSAMDAEASRVQAFIDRMDAGKKPFSGLPIVKAL